MIRGTVLALLVCAASPLAANGVDVRAIVQDHILPRYETLAMQTAGLAQSAVRDCSPGSTDLVAAYHGAFDAWVEVSHLRFGPSEQADRAFALAFWPDPRGSTPKAPATLIRDADPIVDDRQALPRCPSQHADFMRWSSCCLIRRCLHRAMRPIAMRLSGR
ncbi:MAG: imelysin family protein [Pseudomonadota bacterium]